VNAPHLVALVRAGARFEHGKLVEREVPTASEESSLKDLHLQVLTISQDDPIGVMPPGTGTHIP